MSIDFAAVSVVADELKAATVAFNAAITASVAAGLTVQVQVTHSPNTNPAMYASAVDSITSSISLAM